MSVFNASVLLLTMNFVITLSKKSANPLGYRFVDPKQRYFDNVMTKFMIKNSTDAWKTCVNWLNGKSPRYLFVNTTMVLRRGAKPTPPPPSHPSSFSESTRGYFLNSWLWSQSPLQDWSQNGDLLSVSYNFIKFCLLNTTHYCTTVLLFS